MLAYKTHTKHLLLLHSKTDRLPCICHLLTGRAERAQLMAMCAQLRGCTGLHGNCTLACELGPQWIETKFSGRFLRLEGPLAPNGI